MDMAMGATELWYSRVDLGYPKMARVHLDRNDELDQHGTHRVPPATGNSCAPMRLHLSYLSQLYRSDRFSCLFSPRLLELFLYEGLVWKDARLHQFARPVSSHIVDYCYGHRCRAMIAAELAALVAWQPAPTTLIIHDTVKRPPDSSSPTHDFYPTFASHSFCFPDHSTLTLFCFHAPLRIFVWPS